MHGTYVNAKASLLVLAPAEQACEYTHLVLVPERLTAAILRWVLVPALVSKPTLTALIELTHDLLGTL